MINRLSTAGLHNQGLVGLLKRQSDVAETQRQMVTGTKLDRAGQDPVGFATGQRMDHALAALDQFERNAASVGNRLQLHDLALSNASDLVSRARELAVQGSNTTLTDTDRASLATEIRGLRSSLLSIANRDDGNGRQLFAGTRHGVVPFAESGSTVTYVGDDATNAVEVAPGLTVDDIDSGSAVFLRVRTGDGVVRGTAGTGNTGTGVLAGTSVVDYAQWGQSTLTVSFTAPGAYEVRDEANTVVSTGAYVSGQAVRVGGVQLDITGIPAAGDTFTAGPAPNRDIFATLQQLADALDAPTTSGADRARQRNIVGAALSDLSTAQDHLLNVRGSVGRRLQSIDAGADANMANSISLRQSLSVLRDVDYAEAASKLSLQMTAIEAAQRTMMRVQGLSLFDRM